MSACKIWDASAQKSTEPRQLAAVKTASIARVRQHDVERKSRVCDQAVAPICTSIYSRSGFLLSHGVPALGNFNDRSQRSGRARTRTMRSPTMKLTSKILLASVLPRQHWLCLWPHNRRRQMPLPRRAVRRSQPRLRLREANRKARLTKRRKSPSSASPQSTPDATPAQQPSDATPSSPSSDKSSSNPNSGSGKSKNGNDTNK